MLEQVVVMKPRVPLLRCLASRFRTTAALKLHISLSQRLHHEPSCLPLQCPGHPQGWCVLRPRAHQLRLADSGQQAKMGDRGAWTFDLQRWQPLQQHRSNAVASVAALPSRLQCQKMPWFHHPRRH